ncbi:MAG: hypothetical protein A2622_05875 [Bdellovibrionales bacterium RIFCSPHIGHO2_01_FULL_40_29]|nr:MAG: hypothetical protein A2622_05875 [Bdellovibrionales bacterium RIFCSPHIGHO2_01_FULL_40_29]OFZ34981.1 MAG: hypothetical protein A3D17_06225 [Bdellovibrionales bacterium RIFCSPHIGHO2_02_FULL_40_15]
MKTQYLKIVLDSMPRVLSLLDRNPLSNTYGCFDRSYWWHKKTDYAVSTAQMSVKTLAYLYNFNFEGNIYFKNENVLNWIKASLRFTLKIQHNDGSFDEWYPNERGWGGPTGYVAGAVAEAILVFKNTQSIALLDELMPNILSALSKAAKHLLKRDEGDILANHYAISIVALVQINHVLPNLNLQTDIDQWLEQFYNLFTNEGWALEYDGCDLGYSLGTLNFLADIFLIYPSEEILKKISKLFAYLNYFVYPDGTWGGNISSRHTTHRYYFALEFWSKHSQSASDLLIHMRNNLINSNDVPPLQQEDHYIHYRLADYLKAALYFNDKIKETSITPFYQSPTFSEIYFENSGHYIKKFDSFILWIALKKGGAIRVYNLNTQKSIIIHNGLMLCDFNNQVYTSFAQSESVVSRKLKPSLITKNLISCENVLHKVFIKKFNPLTFILFRLVLLGIKTSFLSFHFKKIIRFLMITGDKSVNSFFKRTVRIVDNQLIINDSFKISKKIQTVFAGGDFYVRYVPQANYFSTDDLQYRPLEVKIKSPTSGKTYAHITTVVNLQNSEVNICAE